MTDDPRIANGVEMRRTYPFMPIKDIAATLHLSRPLLTEAIRNAGLPMPIGRMKGKHAADAKLVDESLLDDGDLLHALIEHHPYGLYEPTPEYMHLFERIVRCERGE